MSSSLKIASWNINSIRARAEIVEKFLTEEAPDILCLQETKVRDSEFPEGLFRRLGYNHIIICGQPMHHGGAIAAKGADRARARIVEKILTEEAPDILCLQETKVRDSEFPEGLFRRLGYNHIIICGQPMHHGVAIQPDPDMARLAIGLPVVAGLLAH